MYLSGYRSIGVSGIRHRHLWTLRLAITVHISISPWCVSLMALLILSILISHRIYETLYYGYRECEETSGMLVLTLYINVDIAYE